MVGFRPIGGIPGYAVGSDGAVYSNRRPSHPNYKLTPLRHPDGTRYIRLRTRDGQFVVRSIARLVLTAFVGPRPRSTPEFRNGDQADCRLVNLRWRDWRLANVKL